MLAHREHIIPPRSKLRGILWIKAQSRTTLRDISAQTAIPYIFAPAPTNVRVMDVRCTEHNSIHVVAPRPRHFWSGEQELQLFLITNCQTLIQQFLIQKFLFLTVKDIG